MKHAANAYAGAGTVVINKKKESLTHSIISAAAAAINKCIISTGQFLFFFHTTKQFTVTGPARIINN